MQLYQFQTNYLDGLPAKYIFAADTGVGKTVMALAHYQRHAYPKPLLILAPASKVGTGDWQREVTAWFGAGYEPDYEIYSYEKFSRNPTMSQMAKGDRGVWRDWLARHPDDFAMIADEVHKAKNPQSGIGKRVYQASQAADFFVGLSATPIGNGYIDLANYFKIWGFSKGITAFKNRYCNITTYRGFPVIEGYYHEDELKKLWSQISKPLDKQQALDLPPITIVPITLPAGINYFKVLKERVVGEKFLDNPSALLHALRQSVIEPKIVWLDNFLEGVSDNVVVFYNYIEERERMLEMIAKNHKGRIVFRQDGQRHEIPGKDRWAALNRTITLAHYKSGGTGLELTYAATTVYLSPTYSYIEYNQSIGRIRRHGQTKKQTLYLLCSPTTIEKAIWGSLRDKKDFSEKVWYTNLRETLQIL